jgi:hypothetical protein
MERGAVGLRALGGSVEPLGVVGSRACGSEGEAVDRPCLAAVAEVLGQRRRCEQVADPQPGDRKGSW